MNGAKATCAIRTGAGRIPPSQNRRQDLRLFDKAGPAVERSHDFHGFMKLCELHLARRFSAIPVHTAAEIGSLAARFPDNIRLYAVHSGARMVGGVILYANAACAKIQYAAHDDFGRENCAVTAIYDYIATRVLNRILGSSSVIQLDQTAGSTRVYTNIKRASERELFCKLVTW